MQYSLTKIKLLLITLYLSNLNKICYNYTKFTKGEKMPALFIRLFNAVADSPLVAVKACHCNCYFKLKTKLALLLHHYIPRCPYYTTFYAFRRTGVHPPQNLFSL